MNRSKLLALAYPLLLSGMGGLDLETPSKFKAQKEEWERKMCKSCISFPCRTYQSPTSKACCKYIKRKGRKS